MPTEERRSLRYLWKWTLIALVSGAVGVTVTYGFVFLLNGVNALLPRNFLLLPWAIGAALIVSGIFHRFCPDAWGEGFPSYRHGLTHHYGVFPPRVTLVKLATGFFTLATYGNGGITGPLGRVTSGLTSQLFRKVLRHRGERYEVRLAAICGMAACLGAIFHSSLGAGFFAVEVSGKKQLGYFDLFPAILSSSFATLLAKSFHLTPFYQFQTPQLDLTFHHLGLIALVALAAGVIGKGFNRFYQCIAAALKEARSRRPMLTAAGGTIVAMALVLLINPELLGTSNSFLASLTGNEPLIYGNLPTATPVFLACGVMIILKLFASTLTLASGMNVGFTGPTVIIGMLIGEGCASIFGLPHLSPDSYALMAAGFSAMLGSTINVPLSAAILGIELFGLHFGFPCAFAAVIGFQINRGSNLYDYMDESASDSGSDEGEKEIR